MKHINTLSTSVKWKDFAAPAMKSAVDTMKDEIKVLCNLLQRHKNKLAGNLVGKKKALLFPKPPSRRDGVIASFKDSMKLVSIADDEFHTEIDPAFKMGKKLRGRVGKFTVCVKASVNAVVSQLRGRESYDPIFLTDEAMGIDKFSAAMGDRFLSPTSRARYRGKFRKELA